MARSREHASGGRDILTDVGYAVVRLEALIERYAEDDVNILSFTVQTPLKGRTDYLIVCRVLSGGERFVSFTSGDTVWEALKTFSGRLQAKNLTLKEDQYA